MKKIVFILLVVIGVNQLSSAQVKEDTSTHKPSKQELGLKYLKKANKQRTVGLVLLGTGVAVAVTGLAVGDFGGIGLFFLGTGFCISSIPVFVASGKNRKRYNVILKQETIQVYNNYGSGKAGLVSLGLSIPFGGSRK